MAEYPFFIIVFMALISLPILMILTSKIIKFIVGKRKNVSDTIYECGEPSIENSWKRIPISYFKIALVFILFDAAIVPLCSSTIFFTILRPSPECFPKLLGLLL